jgi:hypothetical protein
MKLRDLVEAKLQESAMDNKKIDDTLNDWHKPGANHNNDALMGQNPKHLCNSCLAAAVANHHEAFGTVDSNKLIKHVKNWRQSHGHKTPRHGPQCEWGLG